MRNPLRLIALSALFMSSLVQAADLIPIEVHRDVQKMDHPPGGQWLQGR